jgi:hypothetical protein
MLLTAVDIGVLVEKIEIRGARFEGGVGILQGRSEILSDEVRGADKGRIPTTPIHTALVSG